MRLKLFIFIFLILNWICHIKIFEQDVYSACLQPPSVQEGDLGGDLLAKQLLTGKHVHTSSLPDASVLFLSTSPHLSTILPFNNRRGSSLIVRSLSVSGSFFTHCMCLGYVAPFFLGLLEEIEIPQEL